MAKATASTPDVGLDIMPQSRTSKPLNNFPLIHSSDVEQVRCSFAEIYSRPILDVRLRQDGFNAVINTCRLPNIALCYGSFGAAVDLDFPPSSVFTQLFPIRGNGELIVGDVSIGLTQSAAAVISPEKPHQTNMSADYEHVVLRIDGRALTEKLAAMTGATITEPLRIDPRQDSQQPAAQMLRQYLPLLVETISAADPPFPEWWVAHTEQFLMTLFLCGHRHNYSHLLEREPLGASIFQVRTAEEYMEANAERVVTLEELADVTGVSAFSLFRSFRKARGYSPREFGAQVRLRRGASP